MTLRRFVSDAGPGFCYVAVPGLFGAKIGHGPLLIGLDTNIVLYLQKYGNAILGDGKLADVGEKLADQLEHLGVILSMWLIRDVRFVVLPRGFSDFKKPMNTVEGRRRVEGRSEALSNIISSLRFQLQEWDDSNESSDAIPYHAWIRTHEVPEGWTNALAAVPKGADRDLVLESLINEIDVFLTNDKKILNTATRFRDLGLTIASPKILWHVLYDGSRFPLLTSGRLSHEGCPYGPGVLAGDFGKWSSLLSIFEENCFE
jgi:hypothetical protein